MAARVKRAEIDNSECTFQPNQNKRLNTTTLTTAISPQKISNPRLNKSATKPGRHLSPS